MEISFEQTNLIHDDLIVLRDKYAPAISVLAKQKGVADILSSITKLIGDIVMDSSLCHYYRDNESYTKATGRTFRVFNGKIYVPINERFVCQGIKDFLENLGISPLVVLKIDRRIDSTVITYVMGKILQPRLTLMCFTNGVVDFAAPQRNDERYPVLHSFDKKYDVVKQYDFPYDPKAHRSCTLWKNFLGEPYNFKINENGVLPERFKRRQLQMFLGSCLMDRSQHSFEYFMILQGDGANGKSVIFRVLRELFGKEEVSPVDLSQFAKPGDEKLRAAASLEGKRLMFCPEENIKNAKTFRFIKQLSSGETMAARKIGGNITDIECPPILMLNTNHKWTAGDFVNNEDLGDKSMLRRVQIINFEKSIPVDQRDTNLSKNLANEKCGIFSWILLGYMNLRRNNFRMPENIKDKVEIMLQRAKGKVEVNGSNVDGTVALYVERKGVFATETDSLTHVTIRSEDVYKNYCDFCRNESLDPVTTIKFGRDMVSLGFERWKNQKICGGDNRIYYHLYLTDEHVAKNFSWNVPALVDEAESKIFEGVEFDDDEDKTEEGTWVE